MQEEGTLGFTCINCQKWVSTNPYMGTNNRNHCPYCLWSKHEDTDRAGDRMSSCESGMPPVALTFKKAGADKWDQKRPGETMLVHECVKCGRFSINRIASDDSPQEIMNIFEKSLTLDSVLKGKLQGLKIDILSEQDRKELQTQLFGKDTK